MSGEELALRPARDDTSAQGESSRAGHRAARVSDEQAIHTLMWAKNYGDVEKWERIAKPKGARGPRWLVTLTRQATISGLSGGGLLGPRPLDVVPLKLALTNREILLFCYGLAIGGERPEPRLHQREKWNW